ncbi:MAG: sulfur carrier protein ThiS adenylyltransferase ThiF [Thermoplasmata archaeon]|nr:MAG: sulfur carrier protein ThiS adenylyltransferase ThiF [Thermoplasmata archaeon]RLF51355.1 MAG: sulfur carrier protein ThiS adenylyltransferase ThiF [Thermoplasmata archaeon]
MDKKKYEEIREKLQESSVGIAGLGGLGSNAAVSLARAGVGRLVLVDFDKVEESNLSRQYYFQDQVGRLKTEAIKENIERINPRVMVEIFNCKLEKGSMERLFKDVDVVIEALDDAEMKTAFIEEVLQKLPGKPVVAASGVAGYGRCDSITTKRLGNLYMCYDEGAPSSEESVLIAPRVALMANWEANLAVEIILG